MTPLEWFYLYLLVGACLNLVGFLCIPRSISPFLMLVSFVFATLLWPLVYVVNLVLEKKV